MRDFIEGIRLGYLAAIIEGEGSITITRHTNKRKRGLILRRSKHLEDYSRITYTARISISNNSVELLEAVKDMIGEGNINPVSDKRSNCYGLCTGKLHVITRVLADIQEYLLSDRKKLLCKFVLEFCESRIRKLADGYDTSYSEREVEIFEEVRKLNATTS